MARSIPPDLIKMFIGLQFTFTALGVTVLVQGMLVGPIFGKEKLSRTLESLLATPLGLNHILLGKAVLASLVGVAVAGIASAGATVVLNAYLPGRSVIWPPPEAWAFFVIVLPLVSFALSTLVGLMLMFGLPAATVNGLAVVSSVALFSLPGLVHGVGAVGWSLDVTFAAMALLMLVVDLVLYRSLTKERVITGVKPTMRCREDGGQC
jgi:ABC-type Na+ efflux pump permease subunit